MLSRIFYNNARYFTLFVLVIIAIGVSSIRSIARQEDPSITNFIATITTFFPGANPARVEALLTQPLENELRQIPEIDELSSTSTTGVSVFNVKLRETTPPDDIGRVWSEIRDAIGDVEATLPEGAGKPHFDDDRLSSYTNIVALHAADGSELSLSLLHRTAANFADLARNVAGTERVDLYGEPEEEVRVELDENAVTARGLSLPGIANALHNADPRLSAGRAAGADGDLLIEVDGDFDSIDRIRDVILHTSPSGSSTRVGDIARVYKTAASPPTAMAYSNGVPSILIGVTMADGLQVDVWSKRFADFVERWKADAPAGLTLDITYDQSAYTADRLNSVILNLAIGIVLVLAVLLLTLGWRAAVVVAVILPLCAMASVAVLYYWGVAIHQMSVTGLVVALGLLVDGSIVMTDEVRKRLIDGQTALDAIAGSVSRLRIPLIASTVTTILAFMPLVILPGPSGDFMGAIAKAVVAMLGTSLILALTITPVLAAWLLPAGLKRSDSHWWERGIESGHAGTGLKHAMDWSLQHPAAAIALALSLPIVGFLAFPTLTAQFFPGTDRDQMYIQVKLPDGRSIYESRDLAMQIDAKLRQQPLIKRVDWTIGESPPAFYYNMYRMKEGIASWSEALILTRDENRTDDLIRDLQKQFDREFPQARIIVRGIDQGPPVQAPLEIELYGPNLEVLREYGELYRQRLAHIADVTHTNASLSGGAPTLLFQLDEEKLRLAQLQLSDAATLLDASLRGRTGGEVLEDTERLPVRVRLAEDDWSKAENIAQLRLPVSAGSPTGDIQALALNTLGRATLQPGSSAISRKNGERLNIIQAYLVRGVLPEEALKALRQDLQQNPIDLPLDYRISFGGDADVRAEVVANIMAPLGMIVALLLATIVLTFNSWRLAAIALLVCVCSLGLSLLSLAIFNYPFGVQALIGVIGSIGVSINAAIIIMTALQQDDAAMQGQLLSVRDVVMDSSRHIVSTTVTTFGGFLPLILEGSQFWPPFAMAIAGGVLLSTIVSFFLVPPLFVVANRMGRKPVGATLALAGVEAIDEMRKAS